MLTQVVSLILYGYLLRTSTLPSISVFTKHLGVTTQIKYRAIITLRYKRDLAGLEGLVMYSSYIGDSNVRLGPPFADENIHGKNISRISLIFLDFWIILVCIVEQDICLRTTNI